MKRIFLPAFSTLLLWTAPVLGQECDVVFEEITVLREPDFGQYTVWDHVYGQDGMEQFADFVPMEDGSVVLAGSFTRDPEDKTYHPLMVQIDPKGKVLWEVRDDTKFFKTIDRIIETANGFAVVGDIKDPKRGDGVYLAQYDKAGKKKTEWPIFESGADLDAKAVVQTSNEQGFILAAQYVPKKEGEAGQYGVVYRLTKTGARVWRRAYTPGMGTIFNNMQNLSDGTYMITGAVTMEDGRKGGWLLRLDNNGAIQWQQTFPRGSYAAFDSMTEVGNEGYLVVGEAKPSGGGRSSGWVMKTDQIGLPKWQRYYAGDFSYRGADVISYKDGRSAVLLDARAQKMTQRTHGRLLTFSPRGYLMNVEDYSEAMGGRALRMHRGPKDERMVSGYAQTEYSEAETPEEIEPYKFDGWFFAGVPLDPYDDPCAPKVAFP